MNADDITVLHRSLTNCFKNMEDKKGDQAGQPNLQGIPLAKGGVYGGAQRKGLRTSPFHMFALQMYRTPQGPTDENLHDIPAELKARAYAHRFKKAKADWPLADSNTFTTIAEEYKDFEQ